MLHCRYRYSSARFENWTLVFCPIIEDMTLLGFNPDDVLHADPATLSENSLYAHVYWRFPNWRECADRLYHSLLGSNAWELSDELSTKAAITGAIRRAVTKELA